MKLFCETRRKRSTLFFFSLIRCLVWVVLELGYGWDSEFELTGAVVGGGSEVDEILESSSHPLG
jgi:hypothetical protein